MNQFKVLGEFYFSQLLGTPIYDKSGRNIGKIRDMAVKWEGAYPQIVGIKHIRKTHELIPIDQIEYCSYKEVRLKENFHIEETVTLRDTDIYISKWLLDKQIIDLKGSKLVRVNDITLSWVVQESLERMILVAVDIGVRGLFRRLGLEFLVKACQNKMLDLQYIKPLENWNSHLQLNRNRQQVSELHPADIADLLEEMDYKTRAGFIDNLDDQQAVGALTEMDLESQVEIIEQMDEQRASDLLEEMPPDEAADILVELTIEKSEELLNLMELDDAEDVRELMQYEEGTAGALMTTEFITFAADLTPEEVINQLRELAPEAETIYYLYVIDQEEHLQGVLSLRELIVASPNVTLRELMHTKLLTVYATDDHQRVAEVINKYGLLAVPVVNKEGIILGIVTVDDILDILIPERGKADTYSWFALSKWGGRGR
ncbi:MAG: MgtE intracellular region [Firmicutes bacterium]|nr:MgtE intracellular region [Bacillota bacterium]